MKDVIEYYNKTKSDKISKILKKFFEMNLSENIIEKNAIDLGCGAGNDVVYLVKNGYKVTAIDKESKVKEIIQNRIEENSNIEFIIENFENIKLYKTNLILANFSLFFCLPEYFDKFIKEILNNINENGYFVRKFFRKRR